MQGSISSGTMRPQDLIPAFLDALREVNPDGYAQIMVNGGAVPAYVTDEGDNSEWWCSEDAGYLLEGLTDDLNEAADPGFYFGAHPGDGADYGFWPVEDLPGGDDEPEIVLNGDADEPVKSTFLLPYQERFQDLVDAIKYGDVLIAQCTDRQTGANVAVVCSYAREDDGMTSVCPLFRMPDEDLIDQLLPPT